MEMGLGTILATLWTAVGIPLVVRGFRWLGSKINQNKALEKSQIDDQLRKAVRIAITNVGNKTVDKLRTEKKLTEAVKQAAYTEAKRQVLLLVDGPARAAVHKLGDAGLDILVRRAVDDREEEYLRRINSGMTR